MAGGNRSILQKPLMRSIPVDTLRNDMSISIGSIGTSSLSYSCSSSYSSSSSTSGAISASSTHPGTVFLPIQITRSETRPNSNKNNKHINDNHPNENKAISTNERMDSHSTMEKKSEHVNQSNVASIYSVRSVSSWHH